MTKANDSANPVIKTTHQHGSTNNERWDYGDTHSTGGLTKREYFAAMALQGICARNEGQGEIYTCNGGWLHPGTIAKAATEMADALIQSLNKEG